MIEEDGWIEVAERLPSDDEFVLLADSVTGLIAIGKIPKILNEEKAIIHSCPGAMLSVTHWKPLPRPPKRKAGIA